MAKRSRVTILGVPVDRIFAGEALECIVDSIQGGEGGYVVTPNPEIVLAAQDDARLRHALDSAMVSLPDGIGLVVASWALRTPLWGRVTGVDFTVDCCREAAARGWHVGFWSPVPGVAARALRVLQAAFPGLQGVAFAREPDEKTDMLFVGLGAPAQEYWMRDHVGGSQAVMVGVGGALDMIAGVVPRAPRFVRASGFEWLWRWWVQPRRWRRIVRAVVVFPWRVMTSRTTP